MSVEDAMYLKGNVIAEPLYAGWYAWSHLISPATCAMNIVGRHLKIMDSYIQAPQAHAMAVKNPSMLGGPFIDYPFNRVEDIKRLRERTLKEQRPMIELAAAIQQLSKLLKREAEGFCLDPLYEKVPEPLKGYVELYYDLQHQPSFRFYEPLLYRSPFYDTGAQSLALYETDGDARAFVLSTPRLPDDISVSVGLPFQSAAIDQLFRMRCVAGSYGAIREELAIVPDDEQKFRAFFTETPPAKGNRYEGEGVRIRYLGHACLLVETRDVSVMSDPVISHSFDGAIPRYTYTDLPDVIDYVLITHNHQDHVLIETLLQLRHCIRHVVVPRSGVGQLQDPSLKLLLQAIGFQSVIELGEFDTVELPGGRITGLPFLGEHADLQINSKLCHHVSFDGWSVLFAADSNVVEPAIYQHVHEAVGDVDVIFLGMECDGAPLSWLYGPLLPEGIPRKQDQSRRLTGCNFERARRMVERFRPREVYIYAMGQEPWLSHIMSLKYTEQSNPIVESNRLVNECRERGIVAERLFGKKEMLYRTRENLPVG